MSTGDSATQGESGPMHWLIPFAAPLSEAGREALRALRLPALEALLRELTPTARDDGDEWSLSPPHERALARELGFAGADGAPPFAAHDAARAGIATGGLAWGRVTPVHWHVGTDQVSLADPHQLALEVEESRALFDAVQPLFASDGVLLVWHSPLEWFAAHESLRELPTASLDRVIGRNVDRWLPTARHVRRLQVQAQMSWHGHLVNEARESRGLLPVNSFWLSHCGVHQRATPAPKVDDRLRGPALAEDWTAWADAWRALDASLTPDITTLTLAGERSAQRFDAQPRRVWSRFMSSLRSAQSTDLLESL
jgi:hypothetical protein